MSLKSYAEQEMNLAWPEKDELQDMVKEDVMALINLFSEQGHSGFSAPYVLHVFNQLARFRPLTPLTGNDDEWMEVGPGVFQNKRCSHVFKEDGKAYDIQGYVFEDENGNRYTNKDSSKEIKFPWNFEEPEIVKVKSEG